MLFLYTTSFQSGFWMIKSLFMLEWLLEKIMSFEIYWYYISTVCGCKHHGNGHYLISDDLWLCGWALLNCIVFRGICHWSRQEIWGRRGLGEGENTWIISRENMGFCWLLFTLQKHENRTESIRIQLKRLQPPKQIGLSPAARKATEAELCFDRAQSQDPKFISPLGGWVGGGEKYRGNLRQPEDSIYICWNQNLEGRHCVLRDT